MKVLQFDFGQLTIDDHIIIGEVTQDRHVEMDVVSVVIETANKYFHGEPWAYISNRTNSYSLNPNVHQNASRIEKNMVAFAIVANSELKQKIAAIEHLFVGNDYCFHVCGSLNEAVEWTKEKLEVHLCKISC
jgi:hypothetical protein